MIDTVYTKGPVTVQFMYTKRFSIIEIRNKIQNIVRVSLCLPPIIESIKRQLIVPKWQRAASGVRQLKIY